MSFDPDDIDRLSPPGRIEVQEWLLMVDRKRRDFKASGRHERRKTLLPKRRPWPHPWDKYDSDRHGLAPNILGATRG